MAVSAGFAAGDAAGFEDALLNLRWLRASSQMTRALLFGDGEELLQKVAVAAQQVGDAALVTITLATDDSGVVRVAAASGCEASRLIGARFPVGGSLSGAVLATGEPLLIDISVMPNQATQPDADDAVPAARDHYDLGPCIVVPLVGAHRALGSLALGRRRGGRPFTQAELLLVVSFANQAAFAIELAAARTAEDQVRQLDDRRRIARDLHDHVIQRLFATALNLQSLA